MTTLNNKWWLWYHSPNDTDWSLDSYRKIYEITTIEDFWNMVNIFSNQHFQNGMFFIMKGGINPMWEDSENISGGCWSFKIPKKDIYKAWIELSMSVLGEILSTDNKNIINGISVSPKKAFCILKIWNKTTQSNVSLLNPVIGLNMDEIIYKAHTTSIDKDKEKKPIRF